MSDHHATPDEPSQSDLRALWRSMRGKSGKGWHPVSVPLFVAFFMTILGGLFTILQIRWNTFDHSIATMEEVLIVRLGSMLAILSLSLFIGTRMAWHWPGTNFAKHWKAFALTGFGLLAGLFLYAMVRVGPGGLLVGVATEWFEGSLVLTSAPFMLFMLIGWFIQSKRVGTDRFCTVCNYTLDDHMNRCPECGHILDGPWRILIGVRQKRIMAVSIYLACFLVFMFGVLVTPPGNHAMRRALIIIPDDRLLAAAAETKYWSDGLEYQMWSRAWNKPGDRRKLVDAMLALPDDVFREDHAELVLGIMLDPDTPDDLRADLLRWLAISVGGSYRSGGPPFLIVGTDPASITPADHQVNEFGERLAIAFRVRQEPGVSIGFNTQSAAPTGRPGASPAAPPNWQDDAFLPGSMIQRSGLGLPIELHGDAPDTIEVEVWLLLDVPYRFGTPAFRGRFRPFNHRSRMRGQAFPPNADGRPDIGAPDPMAMRFVLSVPTDFLHSMETRISTEWSGVTIGIEHAK